MFPFSFEDTDYTVNFGLPSAIDPASSNGWAYDSLSDALEHLQENMVRQRYLAARPFSLFDMPLGAEEVFAQWERDAAARKEARQAAAAAAASSDHQSGTESDSGYDTGGTEDLTRCPSSCPPDPAAPYESEAEDRPSTPTQQSYSRSVSVVSYASACQSDDGFGEECCTDCDSGDEYIPEPSTSRKRARENTGPCSTASRPQKRVKVACYSTAISGQVDHVPSPLPSSSRLADTPLAFGTETTYAAGAAEEVDHAHSSVPPAEHHDTLAAPLAKQEPLDDAPAPGQLFRWTHRINWADPPKWGDDPIPEMPGEAIVGYLKRQYHLKNTIVCRYNGCGKEVSVNTSLKNHLANADHMDLRKACVKCGWSIRHDMWKKRAPGHPCKK
ncbi:hypothetical protein BV20DRAFT_980745 [Pilatotrama ljubarskyi]|nr:hypothetical protein BV20DRAFT_980745 [Pilatotrama ljubarskyi]